MMDDNEELPMLSSSPLVETAPVKPKNQDEIDLPVIKRVKQIIDEEIATLGTIQSLDVTEADFPIKDQLAINSAVCVELTRIKLLVDTAIVKIKEQYE